jgi:hypothetical protein
MAPRAEYIVREFAHAVPYTRIIEPQHVKPPAGERDSNLFDREVATVILVKQRSCNDDCVIAGAPGCRMKQAEQLPAVAKE